MPLRAVTFDFGQTIAELDTELLASRLRERGVVVAGAALDAAVPTAWAVYDRAIAGGQGGHPWHHLMGRASGRRTLRMRRISRS